LDADVLGLFIFKTEEFIVQSIFLALAVFISIFLGFLFIRFFADFVLVAVALGSAILAYQIQAFYPEILMILQESNILRFLGLTLPEQANNFAIFIIASLITILAIVICIPILPFSATYRFLLGVEPSLFAQKKIRNWINQEVSLFAQKKIRNWIEQEVDKKIFKKAEWENPPSLKWGILPAKKGEVRGIYFFQIPKQEKQIPKKNHSKSVPKSEKKQFIQKVLKKLKLWKKSLSSLKNHLLKNKLK
jgi:hypothetical protein